MGDGASERGLGGFAPRGSELDSSVDHSCLSAAPCWLLARTAARVKEACVGLTCPDGPLALHCPGPDPLWQSPAPRSHPGVSLPKEGRRERTDRCPLLQRPARWTPWSLVLFCMVNDLDVARKRKLLKMHWDFGLKDDMLNAQASSFKVVLTY